MSFKCLFNLFSVNYRELGGLQADSLSKQRYGLYCPLKPLEHHGNIVPRGLRSIKESVRQNDCCDGDLNCKPSELPAKWARTMYFIFVLKGIFQTVYVSSSTWANYTSKPLEYNANIVPGGLRGPLLCRDDG